MPGRKPKKMNTTEKEVKSDVVFNIPRFKVKCKLNGGKLPKKSYEYDAGWDVYAKESGSIEPNSIKKIPTGLHLEIPPGWQGSIVSRSGLGSKSLIVTTGTIDSEYRGEVSVCIHNLSEQPYFYNTDTAIAQMLFHMVPLVDWEEVSNENELSPSKRGQSGFGSTDKK